MPLRLHTQTKLRVITDKSRDHPTVTFKATGIFLPLVFKLGHLYYERPPPHEYLFSTSELVQVHRNLGHAHAGSVYSTPRRAYPIETDTMGKPN